MNITIEALSSIRKRIQPKAPADANISDSASKKDNVPKVPNMQASFMMRDDSESLSNPVLLVEQNAFSQVAIDEILSQYQVKADHARNY